MITILKRRNGEPVLIAKVEQLHHTRALLFKYYTTRSKDKQALVTNTKLRTIKNPAVAGFFDMSNIETINVLSIVDAYVLYVDRLSYVQPDVRHV